MLKNFVFKRGLTSKILVRSLVVVLVGYCTCLAQYIGGSYDGFSVDSLRNLGLDGFNIDLCYKGGSYDGSDVSEQLTDSSLPVELSSFTATAGDDQVTLRWNTESELENLGFNIYRSTNSNVKFLMINDQLIPGSGNSSTKHKYEFIDLYVKNGITYWYKLEDVDFAGNKKLHKTVSTTPLKSATPTEFRLYPNYPNPFNPVTTISYDLLDDDFVDLSVYNMRGEKVATLMQGNPEAGSYIMNWDGTDKNGEMVASGIYFLRIVGGSYCRTSKMVFIR